MTQIELDAQRYRYLRERADDCALELHFGEADAPLGEGWRHVEQNVGAGVILDAQVDAALAKASALSQP